jgi:hypothetical protein
VSVDFLWFCPALKEHVDPSKIPGCSGHDTTMLRSYSAATLAILMSRGRWREEAVQVGQLDDLEGAQKEAGGAFADVTAEVAADFATVAKSDKAAAPAYAALRDKVARQEPGGERAARFESALEAVGADGLALAAMLESAASRVRDITRHAAKSRSGDAEQAQDVRARAFREGLMEGRIGVLVPERDAARHIACVALGKRPPFELDDASRPFVEQFLFKLGISTAEWQGKLAALPPAEIVGDRGGRAPTAPAAPPKASAPAKAAPKRAPRKAPEKAKARPKKGAKR